MIGRIFLGRYEAVSLIGEGGMGKVYLARQLDLDREVVVKVMHEHVAKDKPKILKKCALPLTRPRCVHHIVTDLAFIDVTADGLLLREVAPGVTPEQVQKVTEPRLRIAPDLREMPV